MQSSSKKSRNFHSVVQKTFFSKGDFHLAIINKIFRISLRNGQFLKTEHAQKIKTLSVTSLNQKFR